MTAKLHIQNQAKLPFSQQAELVFDGMRHRFFRTLLTWTVVTLAVAFVCYVLAEQKLVDAADRHAAARLDHFTAIQRMASWLDQPTDARTLQRRTSQIHPDSDVELSFLFGLLDLPPEQGRTFHKQATAWTQGEAWFEALSQANRRVIFGTTKWSEAVARFADPASLQQIRDAAHEAVVRLPGDAIALASSRRQYVDELAGHVARLDARRQAASTTLQGKSLLDWLAQDGRTPAQASSFFESLGIKLADTQPLINQARLYQQMLAWSRLQSQQAAAARQAPSARQAAAAASKQTTPATQPAATTQPTENISADAKAIYLQQTAADAMRLRILQAYPGRDQGNRTPWLVGTAFLVCLAGVSNAMLVSVLERFREIATMKCLGAMDGFIGTIFLAEASIIGLVGGLAGGVIGILAAIARVGWTLGSDGLETLSLPGMGFILLMGIACGWLLAVLSSIYPAIAAAKMPPMAAMRVD